MYRVCGHRSNGDNDSSWSDFTLCAEHWQPEKPYQVRLASGLSVTVTGLYPDGEPTAVLPCAGCGTLVVRGARAGYTHHACSRQCAQRTARTARRRAKHQRLANEIM
ncbi:hypothetical protein GIS00_26590 [Nakamurella sp. YIM 132087]|uniref:Uncharacterized protein n=1 Tax=Nakamurella alba TaxID=2665158 RepID=A0A7K1FTQ0_9ACTN|nr:hypothetical protein [Nakamurella alba]MTD17501.1 hypothetical protein [Nakamurella alba]